MNENMDRLRLWFLLLSLVTVLCILTIYRYTFSTIELEYVSGRSLVNYVRSLTGKSTYTTVHWQVQYWGGPKFNMKDGIYFCPELNASVRYTSKAGYPEMKGKHVVIFHHMGSWDPQKIARNTSRRIKQRHQCLYYQPNTLLHRGQDALSSKMEHVRRWFLALLLTLFVVLLFCSYNETDEEYIARQRNFMRVRPGSPTRSGPWVTMESLVGRSGITANNMMSATGLQNGTIASCEVKSSRDDIDRSFPAGLDGLEKKGGEKNVSKNSVTSHGAFAPKRRRGGNAEFQVQYWGGQKFNMKDGVYHCPGLEASVRYTSRKNYDVMRKSHVSILHHTGNWNLERVTRYRTKDQILILWSMESPKHTRKGKDLSVFNWTMTYRHKSEFYIPYGRLTPFNSSRNNGRKKPNLKENWADGKTKLAAWVASNCRGPSWNRSGFVETLQKYMDIDTFGKCGKTPCNDCVNKLGVYKFYLSFENDQCEDYITEKVWRNGFVHGTVPVVFGANRTDFERIVPRDSFIHVSDFSNVSSLVAYIKEVDKNDAMYNKFFEWRKHSYVEDIREYEHMDAVLVCAIVKKYNQSRGEKYVDRTNWFHSSCYKFPLPPDE